MWCHHPRLNYIRFSLFTSLIMQLTFSISHLSIISFDLFSEVRIIQKKILFNCNPSSGLRHNRPMLSFTIELCWHQGAVFGIELTRSFPENLYKESCYSCRAIFDFEPVAHLADGCASQIIKSSLVVHMWLCTSVPHDWNDLPILVLYVTWAPTLLLINTLIAHAWY